MGSFACDPTRDVTKAADVQRLFDETKKTFDTLDVLVNNAGV